ncbi:hypothetical protein LTSESEN_2888, partial [Salmonella enterica subsp. enterica serovar Senftenberg str. A4-543]
KLSAGINAIHLDHEDGTYRYCINALWRHGINDYRIFIIPL